ncbi:MAG: DinB family protein [Planctomycetota bacterium]
MHPEALLDRLERFPAALCAVVGVVTPPDHLYRASAPDWSILEIVCHLAEEEKRDFPPRLRSTLEDPEREWPPIDPEGWAIEGAYRERDLATELVAFESRRAVSVAEIRAWPSPNWDHLKQHPKHPIRAGDLLASWCDHDALHLRQIARRLHELAQRDAEPYETRYAGDW